MQAANIAVEVDLLEPSVVEEVGHGVHDVVHKLDEVPRPDVEVFVPDGDPADSHHTKRRVSTHCEGAHKVGPRRIEVSSLPQLLPRMEKEEILIFSYRAKYTQNFY